MSWRNSESREKTFSGIIIIDVITGPLIYSHTYVSASGHDPPQDTRSERPGTSSPLSPGSPSTDPGTVGFPTRDVRDSSDLGPNLAKRTRTSRRSEKLCSTQTARVRGRTRGRRGDWSRLSEEDRGRGSLYSLRNRLRHTVATVRAKRGRLA